MSNRNLKNAKRRQTGFTLIEIMAVVVIIGMLTTIVGFAVFGQIEKARVQAALAQMKQIDGALELYRMENSRYPSTEQGLEALVQKPAIEPVPRNYPSEGYLKGGKVPEDPWGTPFQYSMPGSQGGSSYDLWSFGADGKAGGDGVDADIYPGDAQE